VSAVLTLAKTEHLDRLDGLVAACHAEVGIKLADAARRKGIAPLLEGTPYGAVYLIGPPRAPIGYMAVTFGWSLEFGGMDGSIDEIYVRPGVRGRGVATETLQALPRALSGAGLKALHLEIGRGDAKAEKLFARNGFKARADNVLMSKVF
jgi:ribosomal protein S18 acetylase RimI-like enzyme